MSILADAGSQNDRIIPHTGPASYVTKATTGDPLLASEAGMKAIYHVTNGLTSDGLYEVIAINPSVGPLGGGAASIPLAWISVATGLEAVGTTNLSGSTVALRVLGV